MDEDEEIYAAPERLPFIGDGTSYIHVLDGEPRQTEVAEHMVEALRIVPLERCAVTDGCDGYGLILEAHGRLMMERDLRGLRLPGE